jgi:hypothetical protein
MPRSDARQNLVDSVTCATAYFSPPHVNLAVRPPSHHPVLNPGPEDVSSLGAFLLCVDLCLGSLEGGSGEGGREGRGVGKEKREGK